MRAEKKKSRFVWWRKFFLWWTTSILLMFSMQCLNCCGESTTWLTEIETRMSNSDWSQRFLFWTNWVLLNQRLESDWSARRTQKRYFYFYAEKDVFSWSSRSMIDDLDAWWFNTDWFDLTAIAAAEAVKNVCKKNFLDVSLLDDLNLIDWLEQAELVNWVYSFFVLAVVYCKKDRSSSQDWFVRRILLSES